MRIVYLTQSYPPMISGAAIVVERLAEKHDIQCSIDLHEQFYLTLMKQKNVQAVLEMVSTHDSRTKRPMKISE